jgi:hypothetical protein
MRRRSKPTTLPLGSVSHGTMRPEDVIPALGDALSSIRLSRADRTALGAIMRAHEARDYDADLSDENDPCYDVEALFDMAQGYTPEYCSFGAHEGDGSDYGVWPAFDALEDDARSGEIFDGDELPSPRQHSMARIVSDHGNVSLYRSARNRWIEVWSVV